MKARILPLDDIADRVVLMVTISPEEARKILMRLSAWTVEEEQNAKREEALPVKLLAGYLAVIGDTETSEDVVNTDGRSLAHRNAVINYGQANNINNVNNIHPGVLARRVVEEMGTHARGCNCEYHRVARGGR